jgi:hypothetical protein
MKLRVEKAILDHNTIERDYGIEISHPLLKADVPKRTVFAYPPLINSHDHLVGNWVPKASGGTIYPNTDIWVEEMKDSPPFLERNKVWFNDGSFDLMQDNATLIVGLGAYKNLFSGCAVVQDHVPKQKDEYYERYPIEIVKDYTQCHSISLGNWWGGEEAQIEYKKSKGKMPFIIHLAEGTDERSKNCFAQFEKLGLVQPNTLIIHGIALNKKEIDKCAQAGTSFCCCPTSNIFLIGKTIDVEYSMKKGVNIVLGTDSTMSGGINLLEEIRKFKELFPKISTADILAMVTVNAQKALFLPKHYGRLSPKTPHLMLIKKKYEDPYENILAAQMEDIELLIHKNKPLYGALEYVREEDLTDEYSVIKVGNEERFVLGKPMDLSKKIDSILGYHKDFPFLPF